MIVLAAFIALLVIAEISALLVLRSQVTRYQAYWEERIQTQASDQVFTYVALGNSTAQGIGASRPQKGYVGLIEQSIASATGKQVHTVNLSRSGATLEDSLKEQIPRLKEFNPDLITIEIGANNMLAFDPDEFRRNYIALLSQLPKGTYVADMPHFGDGIRKGHEEDVLHANRIIVPLIKEYGHIYVPLHEYTKTNSSILNVAADLFHPSNRGYKNWHAAFWSEISDRI